MLKIRDMQLFILLKVKKKNKPLYGQIIHAHFAHDDIKKNGDTAFIPKGFLHRIENPYKRPVVIMEAQTGSILKESDIIRYKDIYGRVK